ncbi:MAG TPA: hypothetical protein VHZ95_10420 [Polyangiales bacterium]|nr:hypothetical protein [Polyangiales bacterium]
MLEADSALPLQIAEWAETCRTFVKEALQLELDYTPDTLPILDHYLRVKAASASPEVRDLLVPPLGAYFGEVVRRSMQGVRWHAPEEHYESYRVEFESVFLHFNPLGIAAEALSGEEVEGYGAHFQILDEARVPVEQALAQNDEITPDDYYSFTVRYETLELVTSLLIGMESQHAPQPRRFGRDVYRAASGELGVGSLS